MAEDKKLSEKIYLFTGENHYALQKTLSGWMKAFQEKNWNDSVFIFNSENWDYAQVKQTIFGWWFFSTNKLVIVYGAPLDTEKSNTLKADEVEKLTEDLVNLSFPMETLLVLVSYKPDKRWRLYKQIQSEKDFPLLKDFELKTFVRDESKDLWLSLDVIDKLIEKIWDDQYRLVAEIDKLRYWKKVNQKDIDCSAVENVCFGMVEDDVFKLLDLMLNDSKDAVKFLSSLQEKWMDWNELNGSLMRWLRNYVLILDYAKHWIKDSKIIAADLKQNPWVIWNLVKKLSVLQKNEKKVQTLFSQLVEVDYEIKNGLTLPEMYYHTIKIVLLNN